MLVQTAVQKNSDKNQRQFIDLHSIQAAESAPFPACPAAAFLVVEAGVPQSSSFGPDSFGFAIAASPDVLAVACVRNAALAGRRKGAMSAEPSAAVRGDESCVPSDLSGAGVSQCIPCPSATSKTEKRAAISSEVEFEAWVLARLRRERADLMNRTTSHRPSNAKAFASARHACRRQEILSGGETP